MKKLWFRVKYGHNKVDYVSIEENQLEKTIYSKISGSVIQLGDKFIDGKHIYAIEPNYHKYTGWYDSYEPTYADDYAQIERDCPKELSTTISKYTERVNYLMQHGRQNLIGKNISIPELEKNYQENSDLPFAEERKQLAGKFKLI